MGPHGSHLQELWNSISFWFFIGVLVWGTVGGLWAVLNARGLKAMAPWARYSSIVYGIVTVLLCIYMPFGLFLIFILTRGDVKELFSQPQQGAPS